MSAHHLLGTIPRFFTALVALALPAAAAETWVPMVAGIPPGTPASFVFGTETSDASNSYYYLNIYGFYVENVAGPDSMMYQRIRIPGLENLTQPGAPSLPAVRVNVGVATGAANLDLVSAQKSSTFTYPGVMPWPTPKGAMAEAFDPTRDPGSGDSDGVPETFTKDPSIYGGAATWPMGDGQATAPTQMVFGLVPAAESEAYPVNWNPVTKVLTVHGHVKYHYRHHGSLPPPQTITKDKAKLLGAVLGNWYELQPYFPFNPVFYDARYLIVTTDQYLDELQPFIFHKKSHGFQVTVETVQANAIPLNVWAKIVAWYDPNETEKDHYCLLVGDTDTIPQGTYLGYVDEGTFPTDDFYGSPLDFDMYEEVYVGRLSIDDGADLTAQLQKIIAYQESPPPGANFDHALIAAWGDGTWTGFEASQAKVLTKTYAVPLTKYGAFGSFGGTNQIVRDRINAGVGYVCYDGHGSTNSWSGWNSSGESWHKNEVIGLTNSVTPVVWSFACNNMRLDAYEGTTTDSIGEAWMEVPNGAVASYASTTLSWVKSNHVMSQEIFNAVFDLGLTTHAHAIAYAEVKAHQVWGAYHSNPWMYLLLGDPSMKLRRTTTLGFLAQVPTELAPCTIPGCTVELKVVAKLPDLTPAVGALVSLYKPGAGGAADEVFDNKYTDATGEAKFDVSPTTPGDIRFVIRDDTGNVTTGDVAVKACSNKPKNAIYGHGKPGTNGTPLLAGYGLPEVGGNSGIVISNALPGAFPFVVAGLQQVKIPFDGGDLLASPDLFISVPVPIQPNGTLVLSGNYPNDPSMCGLTIYHQMLFVDPGATGFYQTAQTNGLARTFGS